MKEIKTYRDLMKVLADGHTVEALTFYSEEWVTLKELKIDLAKLDIDCSEVFRVKPTKPSINWEHVSPKFKYLARDYRGNIYLFSKKPYYESGFWRCIGGNVYHAETFVSLRAGNCDSEDSLVERPED